MARHWRARRPAVELRRDDAARYALAERAAEVSGRERATELVMRDRLDERWRDDVRAWLEPLTRLPQD